MAFEPIVKNLSWPNEAATQECARRLAACADIGDALVELHGDLGVGKTTWVRHLLRALDVPGRIKSPTYGVVETHLGRCNGLALQVWHFDFYRLNDPREWADAGLRELFGQTGLKLVEWPSQAGPGRPQADLALFIDCCDEGQRQVRAQAHTPLGQRLLEAL